MGRKKEEKKERKPISQEKKIELCKRGYEHHPENSTHMHILI